MSSPPRHDHPQATRPQAGHAHEAGREARARRADRDGHRLRPPERARSPRRPASTSSSSATRAANNVLGYTDTVPVTVDELLMLAAAVRRGLRTPLLVGDLPFGSYEASDEQAIATAHRFVKEAGCDAVKLEGGGAMAERARAIVARRHPGDGPRRPDAADRDRARRLPRPGPHGRARAAPCSTTRSRCRRPAASRSSSRRSRPTSPT